MHTAEAMCDHVVMITQGRKVLDGSMDSIRGRGVRAILFEPVDRVASVEAARAVPGVRSIDRLDRGGWLALIQEGASVQEAMSNLAMAIPMARLGLHRPSLEDLFVDIVRSHGDGADARAIRESVSDAAEFAGGDA